MTQPGTEWKNIHCSVSLILFVHMKFIKQLEATKVNTTIHLPHNHNHRKCFSSGQRTGKSLYFRHEWRVHTRQHSDCELFPSAHKSWLHSIPENSKLHVRQTCRLFFFFFACRARQWKCCTTSQSNEISLFFFSFFRTFFSPAPVLLTLTFIPTHSFWC